MIILQAPYESIQTTSVLPNPEFSDTINNEISLKVKRSVNGTLYSYIKTSARMKLIYDFNVTRGKGLEVIAFFKAYHNYNIKLINFKDEVWKVKIYNDLPDFTSISRGEYQTLRLEFTGIQVS